jgi:hypothetical protein
MATALRHAFTVYGIVLPIQMPARELQQATTKFWGVRGESRINGGTAGRFIEIPVLVYGAQFNTQAKLSQWFDDLWQYQGKNATLQITSEADRPPLRDCTFDSALMDSAPKLDVAGSLGGGAFATIRFLFRQHT